MLELAQADGQADALAEEAGELLGLIEREPDLGKLLSNRTLNSGQRSGLIEQIFKDKISELSAQ